MLQYFKMNNSVKIFANIGIIIALYYFIYYSFFGVLHPIPAPGDSWDYHIPISQSILHGTFLTLPHETFRQRYYPGSSEAINSLLILLHIPLTLSNIIAMFFLIACLYKLARVFTMKPYYSILFAITFITLNAVVRWQNAVSIDIWVAVFFTLSIILLEKPGKNLTYFAKLGFVFGMLVGSKYTTIYYLIIFLLFYGKNLIRYVNIPRFCAFFIPFSIFGLFWYVRNYLLKGNPFYPIPMFGFKGTLSFTDTIYNETIHNPLTMLNAAYSEYHLWFLSVIVAFVIMTKSFLKQKNMKLDVMKKLFLLGIFTFIIFLTFPTDAQPWIMVSSFRYSYPSFIPLILGVFILAANHKKEEWLGYFAIANMLVVLTMTYYPKLILFYLPISFCVIYFVNKKFSHSK